MKTALQQPTAGERSFRGVARLYTALVAVNAVCMVNKKSWAAAI